MPGGREMPGWTAEQNRSIVEQYFGMVRDQWAGRPFVKAHLYRELSQRLGGARGEGAVERKHQNISAVLDMLGLPHLKGLQPQENIQGDLQLEVQRQLEADPGLFGILQHLAVGAGPGAANKPEVGLVALKLGKVPAVNKEPRGRKIDYGSIQEENQRRGKLGERFVYEYEKKSLLDAGRPDLSGQVRWVARDQGDGAGYDVLSWDVAGEKRYIEVKATSYGRQVPFFISSAELDFARRNQEFYSLYRVYNILSSPEFYVISGNLDEQIEAVPVSYRASLISLG
jgi:hypothetical protein